MIGIWEILQIPEIPVEICELRFKLELRLLTKVYWGAMIDPPDSTAHRELPFSPLKA